MCAESEHSFRKLLDEHLPATTNPAIATAIMAYKQNDYELAFKLLSEAMEAEPANAAIPLTLLKFYLREGRHNKLNDVYEQLPKSLKQKDDFISLKTHSHFIQIAAQADDLEYLQKEVEANSATTEVIEKLCAIALVNDDYESALKYLLDILKNEPDYNKNIAQQGLITIFNLLGQQHPLTKQYRKDMQLILEYIQWPKQILKKKPSTLFSLQWLRLHRHTSLKNT